MNKKSGSKPEGPIAKILVAVVITLLAGGTSPWWWKKLFPDPTIVQLSPECSRDTLRAQLLRAGTDKPSLIKSTARTMRERFGHQDFDCIDGLAEVLLQDDQENGHGLYFSGEVQRVRASQDPSHTDFHRGLMRERFQRYIDTEHDLPLSERDGYGAACYLREKGYCAERTAYINHLMAIDYYRQGQEATNKEIKIQRLGLASERVEQALLFIRKDSEQKGFDQIYPSAALKQMIQEELHHLEN